MLLFLLPATWALTTQVPIHQILGVLVLYGSTGLLMTLWGADLIGLSLIIVYVGAIGVLFLFVVLTVDVGRLILAPTTSPLFGMVVGIMTARSSCALLLGGPTVLDVSSEASTEGNLSCRGEVAINSSLEMLAQILSETNLLMHVVLVAVVLTVAMVSSVYIA